MTNSKRRATWGEYDIAVEADGSIKVRKAVENADDALRKIAEAKGVGVAPEWDACQLGKKIVDNLGDGESAEVGDLTVVRDAGGAIRVLRICDNAKGALREVAQGAGFDYDPAWNTHQLGNKLVGFINKADTGADALDEALDKAGKALEDFTEKLGAEVSDKAGKAFEDIAEKLGTEVAAAADKARDAADRLGAEALKAKKQAIESDIVGTGVNLLKDRFGIEVEPQGCIIMAAAAALIAIAAAYLLWGGTAIIIAILVLGLIYAAYRFLMPKD